MDNSSKENVKEIKITNQNQYSVWLGAGASSILSSLIPANVGRVLLVYPPAVAKYVEQIASSLPTGLRIFHYQHVDGEAAKDLSEAAQIWKTCGLAQLGREDLLIAVGGGATTDLVGFIAATWLRGIRFINIPTTVLAMVDAAVGGKTGINTAVGKNLVGAFYNPLAVICDYDFLVTLPERDMKAGLAEVVKCGFIRDKEILALIEEHSEAVRIPGCAALAEMIYRGVQVKAAVVSSDFKESGLREILNYGHTFGHAIEKFDNYRLRHGEAVAVGMQFAALLAEKLGIAAPGLSQKQRHYLQLLGLPCSYTEADWDSLLKIMSADKKVRSGQLRFVLLSDFGIPASYKITANQHSLLADIYKRDLRA